MCVTWFWGRLKHHLQILRHLQWAYDGRKILIVMRNVRKMWQKRSGRCCTGGEGERIKFLFFCKKTQAVYDVTARAVWSSPSLWGQAVLGLPSTILNASSHDRELAHRWCYAWGAASLPICRLSQNSEKDYESLFPGVWGKRACYGVSQTLCANLIWADVVFKELACCCGRACQRHTKSVPFAVSSGSLRDTVSRR